MSKESTSQESTEKKPTLEELQAENEKLKKENNSLKMARARTGKQEKTKQDQTPPPPPEHTHENCPSCGKSTGEHYVHNSDPFCRTCGDKNPNFKSLALCSKCGLPLGTVEEAQKLVSCPNCGNTGKGSAKKFELKT
jgi:predicted RNA-binding Zn-ribbon protein involved in translation (DUF1610 family)